MLWAHRIQLEAAQYDANAFLTLTYADKCLPSVVDVDGNSVNTLVVKDLQDWLKRLRKRISPNKVRYWAVGEYGDITWRPHYHVALFGFPTCEYGNSRYKYNRINCCASCDLIRDTWQKGNVFLGTLEASSCGYIAGYVSKKMTAAGDPRLKGRYPEFARMSLKPGIGYDAMYEVADSILRYDLLKKMHDVPSALRHGPVEKAIGRYLRKQLRKMVGMDEKAPKETLDKIQNELHAVRMAARSSASDPSFKSQLVKSTEQKFMNVSARRKIFQQTRKI